LCATAVIFGAALLPASAQQPPINVKLTLDWAPQPHQSPWFLAAERGYFAREGLNVSIDRGFGSGDAMAKLAAGSYDIGLGDPNMLVRWNAANPATKVTTVFLFMDKGQHALVTLRSTGIKTMSDLAGKRIAHPPGDFIRPLWGVLSRVQNIPSDKIEWLTVQPNLRDSLLARGGADAVTAFAATTYFNLLAIGQKPEDIVLFPLGDHGFELMGNGLLVTQDFARRNPETIRKFIRATMAGLRDSLSDVPEAIRSVVRRDATANADIETARYKFMIETSILTPHVRANGFSVVTKDRLEKLNGFLAEAAELAAPPPPADLYTDVFLPPVAELQAPK
jgi:NitT/TauT family transport system substrate-binding protein